MSQAKNTDSTTPAGTPAGSAASKTLRKFGRRELLRGTGVAALAAGTAVVPFGLAKAEGGVVDEHVDELLPILQRFKTLWRDFDAYYEAWDTQEWPDRKASERTFEKRLKVYWKQSHACLRSAYGIRAGAASCLLFLEMLVEEMEIGESIFQEHYIELLKSVQAYIASTAQVRS